MSIHPRRVSDGSTPLPVNRRRTCSVEEVPDGLIGHHGSRIGWLAGHEAAVTDKSSDAIQGHPFTMLMVGPQAEQGLVMRFDYPGSLRLSIPCEPWDEVRAEGLIAAGAPTPG